MSWHRIYAIILRYTYSLMHNFDRMADAFYWPTIELVLWGLTSLFIQSLAPDSMIIQIIIFGLIFWYIVSRIQGEISVNLLDEFWNDNLVNLFVSPLKFSEWIMAVLLNGVVKALVSFVFAAVLALILYQTQIFTIGIYLVPFLLLLSITGWTMGFFISGLILRHGTRIQFLGWTMVFIIQPFSAVTFPVSVLPAWAQQVAQFVPTSYVFEGLREVMATGYFDPNKFWISLLLNVIYLVLSLYYINYCFKHALKRGLISVY